jgi:HlyD family secretion protein
MMEAKEIAVSALGNGTLLQIFFDEGERIQQGDTIAIQDTVNLVLQRKGLEAQLSELEATLNGVRISVATADEQVKLARLTADRTKALYESGSATQQVYDETQTKKQVAELSLQQIQNQFDQLSARREQILSTLEQLNKSLHDAIVLAPSSGIVTERVHEPGEVARYGERILTLANLDTMWLKIYLKEQVLPRVSLGAKAIIRVDATGEKTLPGIVRWISSDAEFTPKNVETRESRTSLVYAVKIDVPNPDGILKIGMPAEAEILESK